MNLGLNHDWKCIACGARGLGEEFVDEIGDKFIVCECGHTEILEEHQD